MPTASDLLLGIALPAVLSGLLLWIFLKLDASRQRRSSGTGAPFPGLPLALGAGYAAGHIGISGFADFPARQATEWIFWLAAAATVWAAAAPAGPAPVSARRRTLLELPVTALSAAVPLLLLRSQMDQAWTVPESALWISGIALAQLGLASGLGRLCSRERGPVQPIVLWIAVSGASFALLQSGNAQSAQLAGSLAAALGAAAAMLWWKPALHIGRRAGELTAIVLGGLLCIGYFLAELPGPAAACLGMAPLAGWARSLPAIRRFRPWQSALVALALAAAFALAAAAFTWKEPEPAY